MSRRACIGLILGLGALGCGDSGVLLTVSSELDIPAELESMCLSVADADPAGGVFAQRYPLAELGLPQSLAVEPGRAARAVAQVRGQLDGVEVARARAEFSFGGGGDVELSLAACEVEALGDPEIMEAAGAPSEAVALSRGARRDLLVALGAGEARIFAPRDGALEEVEEDLPSPPSSPRAALAADVNESCEDDLVVASDRGLDLWLRENDGFARSEAGFPDAPGGIAALAAADLGGDGSVDVVAGGGDSLLIYRNDGTGRFSRDADAIPAGAVTDVTSIALADFVGDGGIDILVGQGASEPGRLVLLVADPDGPAAFQVAEGATPDADYVTRRVVASARPGAPADALAATDAGVVHLVNRGDGRLDDRAGLTFAGAGASALGDIAAGDWDGDCVVDVVAAPDAGDVTLWSGEGDGSFSDAGGLGRAGGRLVLDALGGVGRRDLVIAGGDGLFWVTR